MICIFYTILMQRSILVDKNLSQAVKKIPSGWEGYVDQSSSLSSLSTAVKASLGRETLPS